MQVNAQEEPVKQSDKIRTIRILLLVVAGIAIGVVVFLRIYNSYNAQILYAERLNQMKEVTTELFSGLEGVAESKWISTEMQYNFLVERSPQSEDELLEYMGKQSVLSDLSQTQTSLIAVDSDGLYYTQNGRKGLLSEQRYLLDEPDRLNFVSNSMFGNKAEMVFLMRLPQPLVMNKGKKTITIVYYGIAQDMTELGPYFICNAYGGNNGMYVLDEDGLKIFGDSPNNKLKGFNVYTVLKKMDYLHGSSFEDTKAELDENGLAYSNVIFDGEEYYYALYRMSNAEWTLLLTVPSRYVATNTVDLVNASTRIILTFAIFMVITCTILIFWLMSRQQKQALDVERRNNAHLEQLNEQLESASKAKTEFLANMSHDIRTPMNAIVGITNLMAHDKLDAEKMDTYIEKVQTSSHHLLSLINDVLDMSKIESSQVTLTTEPVNFAEQIGQVESIVRPQAEEKGQNFIIRIHNITHEYLIGDAVRLRQIFLNLLSNAVKYTSSGGDISLELEELSAESSSIARFRIRVIDTGCGMAPEFMAHIFEPFTRAENSMTNKVQGTGLGMAITKNIIDLMGGTISIQSEVDKGSCFTVELPLSINRNVGKELLVKNVLLISDEELLIGNIRAALREMDATVHVARSETEADEILDHMPIELVLLGGQLQGDTLQKNIQRLRKHTKDATLIYCCDYLEQTKVRDMVTTGMVDSVLIRPFFLSHLIHVLDQLKCDRPLAVKENRSILSGRHFLCAEDNVLNAEILEAVLDMEGATCTIYPNGKVLVDAFLDVKPGEYDAILMDVQMPVMNGLDATRAIRRSANTLGQTIPIIAMTANAFSEDVQNCLDAGMDAHVAKPIDLAVLERTLKQIFSVGGGDQSEEAN